MTLIILSAGSKYSHDVRRTERVTSYVTLSEIGVLSTCGPSNWHPMPGTLFLHRCSTAEQEGPVVIHHFVRSFVHAATDVTLPAAVQESGDRIGGHMDQHRGLHITLKLAQSLDGRIATSTGESRWISGPESRTAAHRLRAEHDAVLIGVGTVLADNPRLDVRLVPGPDPLRVIVDSRLRTPPTAAVFRAGSAEVLIAADSGAAQERREALSAAGATVIVLPRGRSGIDLGALFAVLEERGVGSILVEGGARLATSVLRERLADSLALFIAMKVIGRGRDAIGDLGIREVSRAVQVDGATVERLGEDIFVRGRLPRRE